MCIVWKYMYVLWVLLTVPLVGNISTIDTNVIITNGDIGFYIGEKGTNGNGIGANVTNNGTIWENPKHKHLSKDVALLVSITAAASLIGNIYRCNCRL